MGRFRSKFYVALGGNQPPQRSGQQTQQSPVGDRDGVIRAGGTSSPYRTLDILHNGVDYPVYNKLSGDAIVGKGVAPASKVE